MKGIYVQEITRVEEKKTLFRNGKVPLLEVRGYRKDQIDMFICYLFRPEVGIWERSICGYLKKNEESLDTVWGIIEKQALNTSDSQHAEWDSVATEVLEHPKVRLYTLF